MPVAATVGDWKVWDTWGGFWVSQSFQSFR